MTTEKKQNLEWAHLMLKEDLYHSTHSYYISANERRMIKRRIRHVTKK